MQSQVQMADMYFMRFTHKYLIISSDITTVLISCINIDRWMMEGTNSELQALTYQSDVTLSASST